MRRNATIFIAAAFAFAFLGFTTFSGMEPYPPKAAPSTRPRPLPAHWVDRLDEKEALLVRQRTTKTTTAALGVRFAEAPGIAEKIADKTHQTLAHLLRWKLKERPGLVGLVDVAAGWGERTLLAASLGVNVVAVESRTSCHTALKTHVGLNDAWERVSIVPFTPYQASTDDNRDCDAVSKGSAANLKHSFPTNDPDEDVPYSFANLLSRVLPSFQEDTVPVLWLGAASVSALDGAMPHLLSRRVEAVGLTLSEEHKAKDRSNETAVQEMAWRTVMPLYGVGYACFLVHDSLQLDSLLGPSALIPLMGPNEATFHLWRVGKSQVERVLVHAYKASGPTNLVCLLEPEATKQWEHHWFWFLNEGGGGIETSIADASRLDDVARDWIQRADTSPPQTPPRRSSRAAILSNFSKSSYDCNIVADHVRDTSVPLLPTELTSNIRVVTPYVALRV